MSYDLCYLMDFRCFFHSWSLYAIVQQVGENEVCDKCVLEQALRGLTDTMMGNTRLLQLKGYHKCINRRLCRS